MEEKQSNFGEYLRCHRIEHMQKGLRETARLLGISASHLTDIEKGRRSPSVQLIEKISKLYNLDISDMLVRTRKMAEIVKEVATQDTTTASKVPEFLRVARHLSLDQWNLIINNVKKLTTKGKEGK